MSEQLTAWSYSRWKTYDTCPLQAKYKFIDKLPEPASAAMERGSHIHDTIAAYLRGDLPEEAHYGTAPIPGWTYFGRLFNELRRLEPLVEQEWGFTKKWGVTGWFGSDTWFRSKLDAGVVYGDGTVDVIDLKTGKPYKDHAQQAELYAISIFRRYPETSHVTVRFWYIDTGEESVFRFSRDMIPPLLKAWTARAERMLNDRLFPPKPGQHCRWCPFAKAKGGPCKYGA